MMKSQGNTKPEKSHRDKEQLHNSSADVVICGAGIAGVAAAYYLSVKSGITNVALVDERPPLTLTSDKSTECYRNWWPGPGDAMVRLMDRSIDLMEELARESDNAFDLNRRGYVYVTASPQGKAAVNNPLPKGGRLRAGKRRSVPDRKVCSMLDTQAVLPNTGFRCWNSILTLCQRAGWTLPASARFCAFAPTGFYNESEVRVKGLSPNGLRPIPLSP